MRRADLPVAYSEGFSPHPKISFPDALPLGYASTGEYAEVTFAAPVDLESAVAALNAAFPAGVEVLQAVPVPDGAPKLASGLRASCWDLEYPQATDLAPAVAAVWRATSLPVSRARKGEPVDIDLRPAIAAISSSDALLRVTLHHAEHLPPGAPAIAVRPTEVDLALRQAAPALPEPVLVTRVAQGRHDSRGLHEALSGELIEPL